MQRFVSRLPHRWIARIRAVCCSSISASSFRFVVRYNSAIFSRLMATLGVIRTKSFLSYRQRLFEERLSESTCTTSVSIGGVCLSGSRRKRQKTITRWQSAASIQFGTPESRWATTLLKLPSASYWTWRRASGERCMRMDWVMLIGGAVFSGPSRRGPITATEVTNLRPFEGRRSVGISTIFRVVTIAP